MNTRSSSVAAPTFSTLPCLLRERAAGLGATPAFAFHPSDGPAAAALTYAELDRRARAIGALLQARCAAGDRALLLYPPGLDFLGAFFGCLYAGVVAVPAYPPRANESMRRLAAIVADAEARVALTTTALRATSLQLTPANLGSSELSVVTTDDVAAELAETWRDPGASEDALAFLQYTSGSTGEPKGVRLTHRQLLANQAMIDGVFRMPPGAKVVAWLPLFHDMGLIGMVMHSIYRGASCALMPPAAFLQRPARWLELIAREGALLSGAPNFAYDLCTRRVTDEERARLDLSRWRIAFNGAEPIHAATLERFAERFAPCGFKFDAFLPCYGMAEASLLVAGKPARTKPVTIEVDGKRLVSSGRAARGMRIVVVDPVSRRSLPDGDVGEIWIRGGSIGSGYWNKPELTRETFAARLAGGGRTDYLRTGDLGFRRDGELFVTGRCKDLIVVRGRNHYPQDLESTAQAAHAALRPHGTAAFAIEDEATEGVVIVQEVERTALRQLDGETVARAIREAVAREHELAPAAVVLVRPATIPKTSSGKIQRRECRRQYLAGELNVVGAWKREASATEAAVTEPQSTAPQTSRPSVAELQSWLIARVAATLRMPSAAVDPRAPLHALGLDSMSAVALSGELEAFLGEPVSATLVYEHPTLEKIARHFGGRAAEISVVPAREPVDEGDPERRTIAIVGLGCRFPAGADTPGAFWSLLQSGRDAVGPIPPERWDVASHFDADPDAPGKMYVREGAFLKAVDRFDPEFFGISPRDAAGMDPQHRLLLEVAWEALEHAGIAPASLGARETGVFMGVSFDDYAQLGGPVDDATQIDPYTALGAARSLAAGRLSYHLGLHGPSLLVDTLCSSSLVAVHLAVQSLRNGECAVALAGGANLMLSPATTVASCKLRALAPDARCKTFDAAADGYGRGEGAGVVVLKRLADARADGDHVLAVIRGSAVNHNGRSNGLTAPSAAAQEALLRKALHDARAEPAAVGFVETHGTGTILGDPVEVQALARVYGEGRPGNQPLLLGAVKTNIGHLEAAAGVAGLIKAVLALQQRAVPANLHFTQPNPYVPWATMPVRVVNEALPWPGDRLAAVSSFGLGGTNAHVILGVADEGTARAGAGVGEGRERPMHVFTLSAQNATAALALAEGWARAIGEREDRSLADLCFTANTGRNHFARRAGCVVSSRPELATWLRGLRADDFSSVASTAAEVAMVFGENVAASPEEIRELHATQPTFRAAIEHCGSVVSVVSQSSLPAEWFCGQDALAVFAVQAALLRVWEIWGVRPARVIGRGDGELAAVHAAGVISLEDAVRLLVARRQLQECDEAANGDGEPAVKLAALALRAAAKTAAEAVTFAAPAVPLRLSAGDALYASAAYWLRARSAGRAKVEADPEMAARLEISASWAALAASVATLYRAGVEINWRGFDGDYARRRIVGLPTYPFQRRRCWKETKAVVPTAVEREASVPTFEIVWRAVPAAKVPMNVRRDGEWIVCAAEPAGGAALVEALAARGQTVRWVAPDECGAAMNSGVRGVLFAGVAVADVFRCVRHALATLPAGARIWLATERAVATGREKAALALDAATLVGFARAFALEHPEAWGGLIDVEGDAARVADALLSGADDEPIVAWRGGERLAPRLVRKEMAHGEREPRFAGDATYLITGGNGALGLALARWLVARGARHLALLGRRGATNETRSAAAELEAAGATVRTIAADVAVRESLEAALAEIAATLPRLAGVFHAAGVSGFTPLSALEEREFSAVLAPKVAGARLLHELTAGRELECFVLFSSIASVWGSHGQTHYAAANSYLDALAQERRRRGLPALSVNWGPWDQAGMVDAAAREQLRRVGLAALAPAAALRVLGRALAAGETQIVAAEVNWSVLRPLLALRRAQTLLAEIPESRAEATDDAAAGAVQAKLRALDATQRDEALARYLHDAVARVLGRDLAEPMDPQQGFFALGMDSLMAVELRAKLEQDLGLALPATLAFDHATLQALQEKLKALLFSPGDEQRAGRADVAAPAAGWAGGDEPIAIVGLGCRFPGGVRNAADFWRLLCEGRDAVRPLPRERWDSEAFFHPDPARAGTMYVREFGLVDEVERFDAAFFNVYPREAASMDPQQRLLLEASWEALEMAGLANARLRGSATGVFVGASTSDYAQRLLSAGDATRIDAYFGTGNALNALAGRVAFTFGLRGPTMVTDTACSSSLVALHQACQSLRARECAQAIAGGVNLILAPEPTIALSRARMLAADGRCKTFSAAADGYGRGEGCGVVVLKRLAEAQAAGDPVLAVIRGTAVNQDGASSGFTVPNGEAQTALVRRALELSGRSPDELDYVEAHGTGTPLGDPIEINALAAVVGKARSRPLLVGAVKTNLGHLESAAGIAGVIKTVLALRHGAVPPHLHFTQPSPHIAWREVPVRVPVTLQPWPETAGRPRVAGVSAFGFTGTNAHVILESAPARGDDAREVELWQLVPLSARTAGALTTQRRQLLDWLRSAPDVSLADVARTLGAGRMQHERREVYCVRSVAELQAQLAARLDAPVAAATRALAPVAFVCDDAGALASGRRWLSWGIAPAMVLGSGAGLAPAAALAGILSDEDAAQVTRDRAAIERVALRPPAIAFGTRAGRVGDAAAGSLEWWRVALGADESAGALTLPAGYRVLRVAESERAAMLRVAAELYLEGAMLEWANVVAGGRQLAEAPTYPFQRDRYWIEAGERRGPVAAKRSGLAALLGERLSLPGSAEVRFAAEYAAREPAILDHHRLFGRVIAPAAQHIALLIAAARAAWRNETCTLSALAFPQAILLDDTVRQAVQLVLTPGADGTFEAKLLGAPPKGEETWALHATGTVWPRVAPTAGGEFGAEATGVEVSGAEFYADLASAGYTLGPSFRWLQAVRKGATTATGELAAPAGALETESYDVHPGLLDSCFQLLGWCAGVSATELAGGAAIYIPAKIDAVRFHRRAAAGTLRCEVRVTEPDHARTHRLRGDLRLRDASGALVLEVDGFEARRMPRALLAGEEKAAEAKLFFALEWDELPLLEGTGGSEPQRWALTGGDAAKDAVAARLVARGEMVRGEEEATRVVFFCGSGADAAAAPLRLLEMVQRLAAKTPAPRVFVVTRAAQRLRGDGVGVPAGAAAVIALARIAALEHPELQVTLIDLDPAVSEGEGAALERELLAPASEPMVALRGGRRLGARFVSREPRALPAATPVRLAVGRYGELDSLRLNAIARPAPAAGEVEIEVRAAGLNFRDVLNALGLLRAHLEELGVGSEAELPLGGECAGVVTAVGAGVTHVRVGEAVIAALATGSLGSHVTVDARFVAAQPAGLSPAEAASLPVVYLTAHYALRHVAALRPGERVLIHAAAGGVGLAAVQVARAAGAEICATASPAKWPLLRALGVTVLGHSRTTDYAREFGPVDMVLNSLTGEHIPSSLGLLRPGGRFVEIGKLGIWSAEQVAAVRPDVAYRSFDLIEMGRRSPELVRQLMSELATEWSARRLAPIPLRCFPLEQAAEAFRLMAQAKHVGKIVLVRTPTERPRVRSDGVYLVTGGLGRIGLAIARWLVRAGAGTVVVTSRRAPEGDQETTLAELRASGATVVWRGADLAVDGAAVELVETCGREFGPLRGVFHAAGVVDDGAIVQQTAARLNAVLAPKAIAARALHEATLGQPIDFFVLFSSLAALLGSPGQATYAAANAELDALAHERRRVGLPALSVAWGPWAEGGMAARLGEREQARLAAMGLRPFAEAEGIAALERLLESAESDLAAAQLNPRRLLEHLGGRTPPLLSRLAEGVVVNAAGVRRLAELQATAAPLRGALLTRVLERRLVAALGLSAGETLEHERSLLELGVDSLLAIELKSWIAGEFSVEIAMQDMAGSTLASLARKILRELQLDDGGEGVGADVAIESVLTADARLPEDVRVAAGASARSEAREVLLTGATGFLGAFLLHELLQTPVVRVHCLVRAKSVAEGLQRIVGNLRRYGLPSDGVEARIAVVLGDLAEPRLGLGEGEFAALAAAVDGIFHNGAWLNFFYPYAALKPANVDGTVAVLRLATLGAPKPVHYVSTSGVFYSRAYHGRAWPESDPAEHCEGHALGYSQSKWVAERLVAEAGERGLPVTIHRAPFITGDSRTGAWNADDFICRLVRGIVALGAMPELAATMDIVPVDYVARAIVRVAQTAAASGTRRYHLGAAEAVSWNALADWLGAIGYPVRREAYARWLERLPALRGTEHPLAPFVTLFLEQAGPGRATVPEVFLQSAHASLDNGATARALGGSGLDAPVLDAALWARYFAALEASGLVSPSAR